MRTVMSILIPGAALAVLTAMAVGIILSSSDGHPSVVLVGAFVADSIALIVIACGMGAGRRARPR